MNKQDATPIKNWHEVEARLKGFYQDLSTAQSKVVQINNEINTIIQSLVINLSEYKNQSEISLWFFSGTPTTSNRPYTDWSNVQDHAGDFYYDKSNGKVYQFSGTDWDENTDEKLIETMAVTNADLAEGDNERKVFFSEPVPPYDKGDWWINENGILYICQTAVSSGTFKESDFLLSSFYSLSLANRTANTLTVLRSDLDQVIADLNDYAKLEDLDDYTKTEDLTNISNPFISSENICTATQKAKKNTELLTNALTIINATDIYKYHFNEEDSTARKHIGFILDSQHNYSPSIAYQDGQDTKGIDIYSVVAIMWQAIKELNNNS